MPLTDAQIRNFTPTTKPFKRYDGNGLFLEVYPNGSKLWRLRYENPKETRISFGPYPEVRLRVARGRRNKALDLLAKGIDPATVDWEQPPENANTFETIAREYWRVNPHGLDGDYLEEILRTMGKAVFPRIGHRPIQEIDAPVVLKILTPFEQRGAHETARKILGWIGQVFRYGISTARCQTDVTRGLASALAPVPKKHFAAVTDPGNLAGILRAIDTYEGTLIVQSALRLVPLLFVRSFDLRHAKWKDIDLDASRWTVQVRKRIKNQPPITLIVPLARQAAAILSELKLLTGKGLYVFPHLRNSKQPMSDNAILAALRRMGIPKEVTSQHGFRATARTLLDQELHFRADIIEHQLAHSVRSPNGRAYNRTAFLHERTRMMQSWADYLDKLKSSLPWKLRLVQKPPHQRKPEPSTSVDHPIHR